MRKRKIGGRLAERFRRRGEARAADKRASKRRSLLQETLEQRQLLAADIPRTFVLDFVEPGEPNQTDQLGTTVSPIDPTSFGLTAGDLANLKSLVRDNVEGVFQRIPDAGDVPGSPLPDGAMLDLDIVLGNANPPPTGRPEYFVLQIGSLNQASAACAHNFYCETDVDFDIPFPNAPIGSIAGSVFTDSLAGVSGANGLAPAANAISQLVAAAIGGTTGLEITPPSTPTPSGAPPVMSVASTDFTDPQRLGPVDFAINAPIVGTSGGTQAEIQRLVDVFGFSATTTSGAIDAPTLISIAPNDGQIFLRGGDPNNIVNTLNAPPTELTFRFDGNQLLDRDTFAEGIRITRSVDGQFGNGDDEVVDPGFLGFGDTQRIVIARFSETLPDDSYRVELFGFDDPANDIAALRNSAGQAFVPAAINGAELDGNNDLIETFFFDLELGALVTAIVPQPIERDSGGNLIHHRDRIEVYFNDDDLYNTLVTTGDVSPEPSVVDPRFYKLILTNDTVQNTDDQLLNPTSITYDPALNRAVLSFEDGGGNPLDLADFAGGAGTFRLRIGTDETVVNQVPVDLGGIADPGDSFANPDMSLGVLTGGAQRLRQQLRNQTQYPLDFPGNVNEIGHRELESEIHLNSGADTSSLIPTIYFNFDKDASYGLSATGQPLFNSITPDQEERAREIFDTYGEELGIDFVEVDTRSGQPAGARNIWVVTGDLAPLGGVSGAGDVLGINSGNLVLMDIGEGWNDARGPSDDPGLISWQAVANHEIGHALGLGHATDLPPTTNMGGLFSDGVLGGESRLLSNQPVEPIIFGDQDVVHGRHLYRPDNRDIDLYQFQIPAGLSGQFTAETFAERLEDSSTADTFLTLFRENPDGSRQVIATNDDFYSQDSFLNLPLQSGTYWLGVTASGNGDIDPTIRESGLGGVSQGPYELLVNFRPNAFASIVDTSGTLLDGDADGNPGGSYDFWFRTALPSDGTSPDEPRTFYVDKAHNVQAGPVGTVANPFNDIDDAFAFLETNRPNRGDIVRIVGNGGLDGNVDSVGDNFAYEIGLDALGAQLPDGRDLIVPRNVTVMVDSGAIFKMGSSRVAVGSTPGSVNRSLGAFQVLGTPDSQVIFTSQRDENTGIDTDSIPTTPGSGDWGGISFRNDVDRNQGRADWERRGIFLNYVAHAHMQYGGGQVNVDSDPKVITPIHMTAARPTIAYNEIRDSDDAGLSADPTSFEETNFQTPFYQRNDRFLSDYDRVGPDIRGNRLTDNTVNGMFVRVDTLAGNELQRLTVPARFDDTDVVHVIGENLIIDGTPGGPEREVTPPSIDLVTTTAINTPDGGLTAGSSYRYKVTFTDINGNESVASADINAGVLPGGSNSIRLNNLPPAADDFVGRRVYRSTNFGSFELVAEIDRSAPAYVDEGGALGRILSTALNSHNRARTDARLTVDPGIVVKATGSRIEMLFGAQLIAEGRDGQRVIFTSRADDRFGAGGTFDTNGDGLADQDGRSNPAPATANVDLPDPGDWGGIYAGQFSELSLDFTNIQFAGGVVGIDGNFAGFNAVEIHRGSDARIANSIFEDNASGLGGDAGQNRFGRGFNREAVIFVRGAQPVILDNIIRDSQGADTAAISINANAMISENVRDLGRQTGLAARRTDIVNNRGPILRGNQLSDNGINGVVVRGETLTTETVWDDADIVHVVVQNEEILVPDFHVYGGLRLQSSPTESLVVKFGQNAGLTANGRPLDIEDRIGGRIQVMGTPGFPVVMTSLSDDSAGSGFTPEGVAQLDTNGDGPSQGFPGDWRSIRLDEYSHDRNVADLTELESPQVAAPGVNAIPGQAQFIGQLAPSEKESDDQLRLGFTIHGVINQKNDIDVYSFRGEGGTEVWIDIDRTRTPLDAIVELVDANGRILAQSDNSFDESGETLTLYFDQAVIPQNHVNVLQRDPFAVRNVNGTFRDGWTTNVRDAGMRVILPGSAGVENSYFVRVRSSNIDPKDPGANRNRLTDPGLVGAGLTSGTYQLQLRLREADEFGGSVIRFADIRYATIGIEANGLPSHSPFLGEAGESQGGDGANNNAANAEDLGSASNFDRGTISVAGNLIGANDIDFYGFEIAPDSTQDDPDVQHTPMIFDIDYANGIGRPNTSLWLYRVNGSGNFELVAIGTDSNISDDRSGPGQGTDQDDLSRGSAGPLDAFIGSQELPSGQYVIGVSNNSRISRDTNQFYQANPDNALVRFEPLNSVRRVSSDHFENGQAVRDATLNTLPTAAGGSQGPMQVAFSGVNNVLPYTLADVNLYISTDSGNNSQIFVNNPFTGELEANLGNHTRVLDVAMRPDGNLYGIERPDTVINDNDTDGIFNINIEGVGGDAQVGGTGIQTFDLDNTNNVVRALSADGQRNGTGLDFNAVTFVGSQGNSLNFGNNASNVEMLGIATRSNGSFRFPDNYIFRINQNFSATSAPSQDRQNAARIFGAGTQIVERGVLDTTVDRIQQPAPIAIAPPASGIGEAEVVIVNGTRFEYDQGISVTYDLTSFGAPGTVDIVDGDSFTITGPSGSEDVELETGVVLDVENPSQISVGDTITLEVAGRYDVVFEFVPRGTPVTSDPTFIPIEFESTDTNAAVAQAIADAVNALNVPGQFGQTGLTAQISRISSDRVDFSGDTAISLSLTNAGAIAESGSYGIAADTTVAVNEGMSDAEFAASIVSVIDGASLSGVVSGAVSNTVVFAGATSVAGATATSSTATINVQGYTNLANAPEGQTLFFSDGGTSLTAEFKTDVILTMMAEDQIAVGDSFEVDFNNPNFHPINNPNAPQSVIVEFDDGSGPVGTPNVLIPFDPNSPLPRTAEEMAQDVTVAINNFIASISAPPSQPIAFQAIQSLIDPTRIDFVGDTAFADVTAPANAPAIGFQATGDYTVTGDVAIPVHEGMIPSEKTTAIINALSSTAFPASGGTATQFSVPGASTFTSSVNWVNGTVTTGGVASGAIPVPIVPGEGRAEVADRLAAVIESSGVVTGDVESINGIIQLPGSSVFSNTHASGTSFTFMSMVNRGFALSGVAALSSSSQVFAVSEMGNLFEIGNGGFNLASRFNSAEYKATIRDPETLQPIRFAGLTAGPRNQQSNRYADAMFGISTSGRMYAFDTEGRLLPVFEGGAYFIDTGRANVTGLAFSNLDVNLWHQTRQRGGDAGHGVNESFDGSRLEDTEGRNSLYFGFEQPTNGNQVFADTQYFRGIYNIADNGYGYDPNNLSTYNFAGGAHGVIESNAIDLSGFSPEDRPALYFNYYLETEADTADIDAVDNRDPFVDSFRVYAAGEDGIFELVSTNNSSEDNDYFELDDEYDILQSGNSTRPQELFDVGSNGAPDGWRQARVSLDQFAGERGVRLKFVFSTEGGLSLGNSRIGGEELRAVPGSRIDDGDTFEISEGGSSVVFEFDLGVSLNVPSGANITDGAWVWIDGQKYVFRLDPVVVNPGEVGYSAGDSASDVAASLRAVIQATDPSLLVRVNPDDNAQLAIPTAELIQFDQAGLPADFLTGKRGVTPGRVAVPVHFEMTDIEVRDQVRQAMAENLNTSDSAGLLDSFPVHDHIIQVYNHPIVDSGPLGWTRSATDNDSGLPAENFGPLNDSNNIRYLNTQQESHQKYRNNQFEGVYLDDIVIGFREHGEMVTGALTGGTGAQFVANPEYQLDFGFEILEVETGPYQLEIRRGADYALTDDEDFPEIFLTNTFDTNQRMRQSYGIVAEPGAEIGDGDQFVISDGVDTVVFEFDDITLPLNNPNRGVTQGNIRVPYSPRWTASQVAVAMRNAINGTSAQSLLDVTAGLADGTNSGTTNPTGYPGAFFTPSVSTSSATVILHAGNIPSRTAAVHGSIAASDRFGSALFTTDPALTQPVGFQVVSFGNDRRGLLDVGDENLFRDQGQVLLVGNIISNSLDFGIRISAGDNDVTNLAPRTSTEVPRPGSPRNTQELNNERIAPGVVATNNLIFGSGQAGINVVGEPVTNGEPNGPQPFARLINNTVYGTRNGDTGILVQTNSTPTLLNNIVANTSVGVNVQNNSSTTVIGATLFQNNANNVAGAATLGSFPIILNPGDPLFLDPNNQNFYLDAGSRAIDSSVESLNDRPTILRVKGPMGIGDSPIIAPSRDVTGQLRVDDPTINTPAGQGANVFIDRGAFDRSDFVGPVAQILRPQDNDSDGIDQDPNDTFIILNQGTVEFFELLLSEGNGSGPDSSTIDDPTSAAPNILVSLTENGRLLREGTDYVFGFSETNRTIRLTPLAGIWRPDAVYEITLNNKDRHIGFAPAGEFATDGSNPIEITDRNGVTAFFEYETGYVLHVPKTLTLTVPRNGGSAISDGQTFSVSAGGTTRTFEFDNNLNTIINPSNTPISFSSSDSAQVLRDKIVAALQTQANVLGIDPKPTREFDIHLGSTLGNSVSVGSTPLILSGDADGADPGESFIINQGGQDFVFSVGLDNSATHEEIAEAIAADIRAQIPELAEAVHIEDGVILIGGDENTLITLDDTSTQLTLTGEPGVTDSLSLEVPVDNFGNLDVNDAETFSITGFGVTVTFEFNDVDGNAGVTLGNQIINFQTAANGGTADSLASSIVSAINSSVLGITAEVIPGTARIRLNEPVGFSVDQGDTRLIIDGVGGGAFAVPVAPRNFTASDTALALVSAINDASRRTPFSASAAARGSETLFINDAARVRGLSAQQIEAIADIAGNHLQANRPNNETQFTIVMPELGVDYGDAPTPYPSLLAANGARHVVVPGGPLLGSVISSEGDALTDVNAVGDDDDGLDVSTLVLNQFFPSPADAFGTFSLVAGTSGLVDAWIDWNRDGDWNDTNEQFLHGFFVEQGTHEINIPYSATAVPGDTFVRVRISTTGRLSPTGLATDGEVEDYKVTIIPGAPPTAGDVSYSVDEDFTSGGIDGLVVPAPGLLSQTTDPDNDPIEVHPDDHLTPKTLQYEASPGVFVPAGTVDIDADGGFHYEPAADFFTNPGQPLTFTFRAVDDNGLPSVDPATVSITVNPVNDQPTVADDPVDPDDPNNNPFQILEDVDTVADRTFPTEKLLRNDSAGPANENQTLTIIPGSIQLIPAGTAGATADLDSVTISPDGSTFTVTAIQNTSGIAKFTYRVDDGSGEANSESDAGTPATVTIEILQVNDPPVQNPNTPVFNTDEDTQLTGININTILSGDFPADPNETPADSTELNDQTVELVGVSATSTNGGTVSFDPNTGAVVYDPPADFFTSGMQFDFITYQFRDIDATTGNDPTSHRRDVNGDIEPVLNGSVTVTGSIAISVNPVNDPPTIDTPLSIEALEDSGIQLSNFLTRFNAAGGPNEQSDLLEIDNLSGATAQGGSFLFVQNQGTGDYDFTYTPPSGGYFGQDTFVFSITDTPPAALGFGPADRETTTVTATVTVRPVNDAPVLVNSTLSTIEESNLSISPAQLLASGAVNPAGQQDETSTIAGNFPQQLILDTDDVGNAGTPAVSLVPGGPAGASIQSEADGSFTVILPADYYNRNEDGSVRSGVPPLLVQYRVQDQGRSYFDDNGEVSAFARPEPLTATGTISIDVFPVNDPPVAASHTRTVSEDPGSPLVINASELFAATPPPQDTPGPDEASQSLRINLAHNDAINTSAGGTVVAKDINNDGIIDRLEYSPPGNYATAGSNGPDTFEYPIIDNGQSYGLSGGVVNGPNADPRTATGTISIDVTPVNDPPVFFVGGDLSVREDNGQITGGPQLVSIPNFVAGIRPGPASARDEVGQEVNFSFSGGASLVTNGPNGEPPISLSGTPFSQLRDLLIWLAPNAVGTETITITAKDNGGLAATGSADTTVETFQLQVTPVNDPPEFDVVQNEFVVDEDAGVQQFQYTTSIRRGPVSATDEVNQLIDFSNIVRIDGGPALFSLSPAISSTGQLRFSTLPDANGQAVFEVIATDSGPGTAPDRNQSAPRLLTITVNPVNDPPTARPDTANANEDQTLVVGPAGLLQNDIDVDGDAISVVDSDSVSALGATISVDANGAFTYDPTSASSLQGLSEGEVVDDTFRYTIKDTTGIQSTAVVTVTVTGVNDAPQLQSPTITVATNKSQTINVANFATDIDSQIDLSSIFVISPPSAGNLQVRTDGTLIYTPAASFVGIDSFDIQIADIEGDFSGPATFTLNVNEPPNAQADSAATVLTTPVDIDVLANDVDPDGQIDPSTLRIVTPPTNGTAEIVEVNGKFLIRYRAAANFPPGELNQPPVQAQDQLAYTVRDAVGTLSNVSIVTIDVLKSAGRNPDLNTDVDDDGFTSPRDALLVINILNSQLQSGEGSIPVDDPRVIDPQTGEIRYFYDVNGDGVISSVDALQVINRLNREATGGLSEGEAGLPADAITTSSAPAPERPADDLAAELDNESLLAAFDDDDDHGLLDLAIDDILADHDDDEVEDSIDAIWTHLGELQ